MLLMTENRGKWLILTVVVGFVENLSRDGNDFASRSLRVVFIPVKVELKSRTWDTAICFENNIVY